MKSITKLKDQARQYEQKEDWDRAVQAYLEVLELGEQKEGEVELPVLNRVGDLYLRMGRSDDAYEYYARAVDRYADVGLYNNAIALCSKALRYLPHRIVIYRRLGQLSAAQGFLPDARRWFLEFAERASSTDRLDEAFEALEEFADLSDDPEVREMLGRQLREHGRDEDAVEQLVRAHALRLRAGQADEAATLEAEIREIDPAAEIGTAAAEAPAGDDGGLPYLAAAEPAAPAEPPAAAETRESEPGDEPEAAEASADDGIEVEQFGGREEDAEVEPLETMAFDSPAAMAGLDDDGADAPSADTGIELESMFDAAGLGSDDGLEEAPEVERLVEDAAAAEDEAEDAEPPLAHLAGAGEGEDEEADAEPLPVLDGTEVEDGTEDDFEDAEPLPILDGTEPDGEEAEDEAAYAAEPLSLDGLGGEAPDHDARGHAGEDAEGDAGGDELDDLSFLSGIDFGHVSEGDGESADVDAPPPSATPAAASEPGVAREPAGAVRVAELPDTSAEIARIREIAASADAGTAADAFVLLHDELAAAAALEEAAKVVEAWVEVTPDDVRAYQCSVEDAARVGETAGLVSAYLALGDCLRRAGSEVKARAVYQQVLDLDGSNEAARAALADGNGADGVADYIDLKSLVGEEADAAGEPAGAPSLSGMLSQFKAKSGGEAARGDAENHYDLGLAFKEMGLIDEAIGEFQTALRGGEERLKVYEELGQCYMLKEQYNVALKVLARALQLPHESDNELLGVYYHLGRCHEELGDRSEARSAYEKIDALDGGFRDVSQRLSRL